MTDIEVKDNSVAIVGWDDGGAGRIETWLESEHGYHISCFINPSDMPLEIDPSEIKRDVSIFSYPTRDIFKNRPLLNKAEWAPYIKDMGIQKALVVIDDPLERYKHICVARDNGIRLINAIHPTVCLMADVLIKENVILHEDSHIGYRAELHDGVIVDGAYLAHHNVIRECADVVAGSVTGGNVTIGRFSRVCLGVVIINKIRIGSNSIIGAGSVIIRDVPDNVTVAGVPGRIIKYH